MISKKIILGIISVVLAVNPYLVSAEEITVTGNGEGTSNTVNISSTQTNQVEQQNTAEITNNVEVTANTGNNEASDNTNGETNIATGNVNVETQIVNAGINQNYAETNCCPGSFGASITNNGSGSTSNISYSQNSNTTLNVKNNASISNNINGYANTGYNKANDNTQSSVSITTGDITVKDTIKNKSINIQASSLSQGNVQNVSLKIANNGSDSESSIKFVDENNVDVNVENTANIENNSNWELNTGGNEANGNTKADVKIATGDIVYTSTIENTDINVSIVDIDCCEDDKNTNPPDGNPPTPTNGGGNGNGGSSNGNGSSSNGQGGTSGPILPVTGGSFSLIFLAIANVALFFLGGYLRLRSGRSPNLAF